MRIGNVQLQWSEVGKIIAGIVTIVISFIVFSYAENWIKTVALAVLVGLFFTYRHALLRRKMSPNLEKTLKGEDDRKKYG